MARKDQSMPPLRIVLFKARIECLECAGVVFLDGPVMSAMCTTCHAPNKIPDDWWEVIADADEDYDELPKTGLRHGSVKKGVTMVYSRGRAAAVACSACDQPLDLSSFQWNQAPSVHCQQCRAETVGFRTPEWLRPFAGRCQYLFGALREGETLESPTEDVAAQPVAMACLNCGATLTIRADQARVTQCDYCSSDYYIPDAIWFRFHKKRRRRPWFAMYWDTSGTAG